MQFNSLSTVDYREYTLTILRQKYWTFFTGFFIISIIGLIFTKTAFNFNRFKNDSIKEKVSTNSVEKFYIVEEGDDLWEIAEKNYGSGFNAYDIAKKNKINDPNSLTKGQKLIIPAISIKPSVFVEQGNITNTAAATGKRNPVANNVYIVKEGDYISKIAEQIYGDQNSMFKIISANNIQPPYTVEIGQKLIIPAK